MPHPTPFLPRPLLAGITAAVLLASAACERDAAAAPDSLVVRDSAGVEIIENRDLGWAAGEGWRLADTPELDIGVLEGDPMYQLFRVAGATRMADGRVAIALAGSSEIRIYGPDGTFREAVGRAGEGPGEFRQLRGVWSTRGDSLLAWDEGLRRVTLLDSSGLVTRQTKLVGSPANPTLLRPLADGRLIVVDHQFHIPESGMQQQFMEVVLYAPTGEMQDSVARFPFARMGQIGERGRGMVGGATFAPRTDISSLNDGIVIGDGGAPQIAMHGLDGGLTRVIRWPDQERIVRDEELERYREEQVDEIEDENVRRERRAYFAAVPVERQYPVYDRILPTVDGSVWLRAYPRPGEDGPRNWIVIDPEGRRLGAVAAPRGLWIFEVGSDYVLGLERDDLDVEHIRLYRLEMRRAGEAEG